MFIVPVVSLSTVGIAFEYIHATNGKFWMQVCRNEAYEVQNSTLIVCIIMYMVYFANGWVSNIPTHACSQYVTAADYAMVCPPANRTHACVIHINDKTKSITTKRKNLVNGAGACVHNHLSSHVMSYVMHVMRCIKAVGCVLCLSYEIDQETTPWHITNFKEVMAQRTRYMLQYVLIVPALFFVHI